MTGVLKVLKFALAFTREKMEKHVLFSSVSTPASTYVVWRLFV